MRMHLMFLVYSDFKGTVSKYNSQNFVEHIIVRNTSNSTDRQTDVDIHSKLFFFIKYQNFIVTNLNFLFK